MPGYQNDRQAQPPRNMGDHPSEPAGTSLAQNHQGLPTRRVDPKQQDHESCGHRLPAHHGDGTSAIPPKHQGSCTTDFQGRDAHTLSGVHFRGKNPLKNSPQALRSFHGKTVPQRTSAVLQLPEVRAPQGKLHRATSLRNLQRPSQHRLVPHSLQRKEDCPSKVPQLQAGTPRLEPKMPRKTSAHSSPNTTKGGNNNPSSKAETSHCPQTSPMGTEASHLCPNSSSSATNPHTKTTASENHPKTTHQLGEKPSSSKTLTSNWRYPKETSSSNTSNQSNPQAPTKSLGDSSKQGTKGLQIHQKPSANSNARRFLGPLSHHHSHGELVEVHASTVRHNSLQYAGSPAKPASSGCLTGRDTCPSQISAHTNLPHYHSNTLLDTNQEAHSRRHPCGNGGTGNQPSARTHHAELPASTQPQGSQTQAINTLSVSYSTGRLNTKSASTHTLGKLGAVPQGECSVAYQSLGDADPASQTPHTPAITTLSKSPSTEGLKILQWNIAGYKSKCSALRAVVMAEQFDVILLQETLIPASKTISFAGYIPFYFPYNPNPHSRGLLTLVKNTIPASKILQPIPCGEGVEVLAVKLQLLNHNFTIYNLYKPHNGLLKSGELFTQASIEPLYIGGDFNAHHSILSSPSPTNPDGEHLANLLEDITDITLLNNGEPTHSRGGRLDLSFINTNLRNMAAWQVHPTLTSDHFATKTTLNMPKIPPPPPPPARWNQNLANWHIFEKSLEEWHSSYTPPTNINQLEEDLTRALHTAANQSMPKTRQARRQYNDSWYYCTEVKNLKNRLNRVRKIFRKHRTEENRLVLQEVAKDVNEAISQIRTNKWLEWCAKLNQHTSLRELWQWLKRVAGKKTTRSCNHANPKQEAERLANLFAERSASNNLPANTRQMQTQLHEQRWATINQACSTPDDTDQPFTTSELHQTKHKGKDTAPGADQITYTMIAHMGTAGEQAYLHLVNCTMS